MALSLDCVPQSKTLQAYYSNVNSGFVNDLAADFSPTDHAGAAYDMTSATSLSMEIDNGNQGLFAASAAITIALGTHNASGFSSNITATNQSALLNAKTANPRFTITATDGTNNVVVATGTLLINNVA